MVISLMILISSIVSHPSLADETKEPPAPPQPACRDCEKPPRSACFNVVCRFEKEDDRSEYHHCEAISTFEKWVKWNGAELEDRSEAPWVPTFEVACDGETIFNGSAHRFTDMRGTRIQAVIGPYPAILLPKGSLRDSHFYTSAVLEFPTERQRGYCYVYTGPQLF